MKFNIDRNIANHVPVSHGGIFSADLKSFDGIIDFSSNVNPLGPPKKVKTILKDNLHLLSIYPDPNSTELKEALANYTGVSKEKIIIGNGASELIYDFCKAFIKIGTRVIIPVPTFGEYESASILNRGKICRFKTMNLNGNMGELEKQITNNSCIFLCNPNNPTGILVTQKNLLKFVEQAQQKSSLVFLDECFIEMVQNSNESLLHHVNEFENLFILRSLTKSFGLAGLRIGYGIGSKKMIKVISRIKIPWSVNGLAQKAAITAISDKSHLEKTRKLIRRELDFLNSSLSKINNFTIYPSSTNFILLESKIHSRMIQKKLLKKRILVRDCSTIPGLNNGFIRIAVRKHKENVALIKELKKL